MYKILSYVKKYCLWIIGFMVVLLVLKSCQSCNRKHTTEFVKIECNNTIDSLNAVIVTLNDSITALNGEISVLNERISNANSTINALNDDKQHLKNVNNNLSKIKQEKK